MSLKPALFNTDMARALHLHLKTSTLRPVVPQPYAFSNCVFGEPQPVRDNIYSAFTVAGEEYTITPQYQAGDYIYVREAFCKDAGRWLYRADYSNEDKFVVNGREVRMLWKPSIHMPREAARTFLHVTRVSIQRVQSITEAGAKAEGCESRDEFARLWDRLYEAPVPVRRDGEVVGYVSYPWEDVREAREYKGKRWEVCGNPWVFEYEFEVVRGEDVRV